ncbi:IS66-like element accessory protein TnpA [Bradyrhizobium elkanii]|uniref:IS66-like element accessory protein TnpA n=1 Tax=Bradyrhizobium elkanii TaxID=29448 RepID=UPI001FED2E16|nr:transposase [Bradyrhizobium elkanii]
MLSRMAVVETGRRRRWTSAEKVRIVEESFSGPRQVSATARRYGISRQLLLSWRKVLASHHPAGEDSIGPTFVPAIVEPSTPPTKEAVEAGQIEIVSPKGVRVVFGPGADVEAVRQFKATFFGFSFQAATIRSYACSTRAT